MKRTRAALLSSLFTALVFVTGQALAGIPNVELLTFLVFVSGFLLGPALGAVVGAAGMGAHSLFNILGAAPLPVWAAQCASYALVGAAGGWLGPPLARVGSRAAASVACSLTGALLVLVYQFVVNAVSFAAFASGVSLQVYLWGGLLFAAVQVLWNAAVFFFAMPQVLRVLARHRRELVSA